MTSVIFKEKFTKNYDIRHHLRKIHMTSVIKRFIWGCVLGNN